MLILWKKLFYQHLAHGILRSLHGIKILLNLIAHVHFKCRKPVFVWEPEDKQAVPTMTLN